MSKAALRRRLFIGSVFWTLGLFALTGVVLTHIMYKHPHAPAGFHAMFINPWPMTAVGILLLVGGVWSVRRGVSAISQLRSRLADVHAGRDKRLGGEYPLEVQPLVADLNALLDSHDANVLRAQVKAGDLAHGLKTPLAVLAQEAERARAAGQADLAAAIAEQVERMRRQIDYHLAHARAAASSAVGGSRTSVAEAAAGIKRALERLHADRAVTISLDIAADHAVRANQQDVEEMLGNLLDNACKWARGRVHAQASTAGSMVRIVIDDDGPGLAAELREAVLQRGVRADQASPGSGLGLAIVRDVAAVYGGTITLGDSPLGGLRATLELPAAPSQNTIGPTKK